MMKGAHEKNRQGDEWRAKSACDDIGRRRQFAHVKFKVAHHAPVGGNLWFDVDKFRRDAANPNGAALDGRDVRIVSHGERERN